MLTTIVGTEELVSQRPATTTTTERVSPFHSFTEYDEMHPQLGYNTFRSRAGSSPGDSGKRDKRGILLHFSPPELERHRSYWTNDAQSILQKQLQKNRVNKRGARNAILFIGDGMSIPTLTATRVYMGGENQELSFEQFPYTGLSKVG